MAHAQQFQDPYIGRVLDGRFEILERIGEGGTGVVYKVRQVPLGRIVAMKMLSQEMAEDPSWVHRFEREARASSQLQHPNTIRMFEYGQTREGRAFMTMEFLDGRSLREVVAEDAPMHPARVLKVLIQCCASLAEAHAAGIIHRDIKPDNVFLLSMAGSPDFVKLLDFSVAKLLQENDGMRTQAGIVFGTPQYMSPEQGRGLPLDARSDLYALGILAYEMLTGQVPFHHDNPMAVLQMHVQKPVPPLPGNLPPVVQQVVYKALEKEPSKRHQSAGEMMQHCQQVFAQLEAQSAGIQRPQPPSNFGPEQKTIVAGGGAPGMGHPGQSHGGMGHPGQGHPGQGHPGMGHPGMGHPGQGHPGQGHPGMGHRGQARPGPGHPGMPQGYPNADPAAQTIIAGQRPPGLPGPQQPPPGPNPASAEAQTIIANFDRSALSQQGNQQPGMAGGPGMSPGPMPGGAPGLPGVPPVYPSAGPDDELGPPRTILLSDSEGVVSFNRPGPQPGMAPTPPPMHQPTPGSSPMQSYGTGQMTPATEGAGTVFWIVCIASGMVVGVLAYLLVVWLS